MFRFGHKTSPERGRYRALIVLLTSRWPARRLQYPKRSKDPVPHWSGRELKQGIAPRASPDRLDVLTLVHDYSLKEEITLNQNARQMGNILSLYCSDNSYQPSSNVVW